ncbi:hypothetical protein [Microlunatus soli]|uniref:TrbC/VIRB2 family protein n=1 Tax=Microlunatus soli TaxID=630515 RepID=A0A1H1UHD2_9ACTN|nr:hypothetical protein [Microlunatus soli]SDS71606.1 hypothetical protein SAMN04489812_2780 [Microlunatus soli]
MHVLETIIPLTQHIAAFVPLQIPGDPAVKQPPGTEGITAVMGWAKWIALAVCILGLVIAGALMAIQSRRGEGGEHVGKIGMALGGVVVISAAGSLVGFLVSA